MASAAACLLFALVAGLVAGCDAVHPVSSFPGTNVQGAPGTADDTATGGQGGQSHTDRD